MFPEQKQDFFLDVNNLPAWSEQTRSSSHDRIHASMSILPKKGPLLAVIAATYARVALLINLAQNNPCQSLSSFPA